MNVRAADAGFQPKFSDGKARLFALDIAIVVAALIMWALFSHSNWLEFWKPETPEDCVYLGRAGAHCSGRDPNTGSLHHGHA